MSHSLSGWVNSTYATKKQAARTQLDCWLKINKQSQRCCFFMKDGRLIRHCDYQTWPSLLFFSRQRNGQCALASIPLTKGGDLAQGDQNDHAQPAIHVPRLALQARMAAGVPRPAVTVPNVAPKAA
jgi:hypothetical protein